MPRKSRFTSSGLYYLKNTGILGKVIFKEEEDYQFFESCLFTYSSDYDFILHNYALIGTQYHILLETHKENLSKFMGQLNAKYAQYYNRKYYSSGHLWQGRFQSWYIEDKAVFSSLVRYVEQKPYHSMKIYTMGTYKYSSFHYFLEPQYVPTALKNAWLLQEYPNDVFMTKRFCSTQITSNILQVLHTLIAPKQKEKIPNKLRLEALEKRFAKVLSKQERNTIIVKAYDEGYSQYELAKIVEVSQAAISGIIKRTRI